MLSVPEPLVLFSELVARHVHQIVELCSDGVILLYPLNLLRVNEQCHLANKRRSRVINLDTCAVWKVCCINLNLYLDVRLVRVPEPPQKRDPEPYNIVRDVVVE